AVFHLGVAYAALATIISQFISAFLCFRLLLKVPYDYRLKVNKIHIDVSMIKKIVQLGIPSGLQNSIIGFANVVVQSYINYFGEMAMAGSGAYSKVEGFAFLPITSFTMAMTTFIGQNMGAKKFERVKKGALFGTFCSVTIAEIIGLLIYIFAPFLIKAFDDTPLCVKYGVERARICALFYCLLAYSHAMASIFRGKGKAMVPMFVMLACWCVVRVSILAIGGIFYRSIMTVNWVYPITWGLSTISFTLYFIYSSRKYPLC
nr:MATE family efflux transporter [Treponema sp.]